MSKHFAILKTKEKKVVLSLYRCSGRMQNKFKNIENSQKLMRGTEILLIRRPYLTSNDGEDSRENRK